jgi:hypothetical protein
MHLPQDVMDLGLRQSTSCPDCQGRGATIRWPHCRNCAGRGIDTKGSPCTMCRIGVRFNPRRPSWLGFVSRRCELCTGTGCIALPRAVALFAEPDYVRKIVHAIIDRAKSKQITMLEEGYDLYLFLKEVYRQGIRSNSKRQALLFPQELIELIGRRANELKQSRQKRLEEVQKEYAREHQTLVEEETAAREKAIEAREHIRSLGIPDWDLE